MAKYVMFFTLKGASVKGMIDRPSDREALFRNLLSGVGGTLEAYYWMFGHHDGMAICDIPDSISVVAVSLAVSGTDAFAHFETHELIPTPALQQALETAKGLTYFPPGG
ncbi:MAG TPA: GYD domain-containing protein [Acidimicrobiales bacterium]|nr:GYD domain-containing protein [Acidimicrobiales bacterium]